MDDCLFCRIVRGEVAAAIIEEREWSVAFRDINPQAPVHALVIPKEHITGIADLPTDRPEVIADLFALINDLAASESVGRSGYRVVCNIGEAAGQEVPHLHFHILGGRSFNWPPG